MYKLTTFLLLICSTAYGQELKVANYSVGKPGTADFEKFSFWVKDGVRENIDYVYGKDWKAATVAYAGKDRIRWGTCFKVKFTNNYVLYFTPKENILLVTDSAGKYKKTFAWMYEGPENGVGTFCEPCAEDEDAAMELVKAYYLK